MRKFTLPVVAWAMKNKVAIVDRTVLRPYRSKCGLARTGAHAETDVPSGWTTKEIGARAGNISNRLHLKPNADLPAVVHVGKVEEISFTADEGCVFLAFLCPGERVAAVVRAARARLPEVFTAVHFRSVPWPPISNALTGVKAKEISKSRFPVFPNFLGLVLGCIEAKFCK